MTKITATRKARWLKADLCSTWKQSEPFSTDPGNGDDNEDRQVRTSDASLRKHAFNFSDAYDCR